MFRIKRSMVDIMLNNSAQCDSFWTTMYSRSWKPSINPCVKFLAAQKTICFGVSCFAFTDYFPMGESTIHKCVSHFCWGLVSCPELSALERRSSSSEVKPFERPPVFLPFMVLLLLPTETSSALSDMVGTRGSIDCNVRVGQGDQLIVIWG